MTPTDTELIDVLRDYGREWVTADLVARSVAVGFTQRISPVGAGRRLARLAREGRCEARVNPGGYMNEYRAA